MRRAADLSVGDRKRPGLDPNAINDDFFAALRAAPTKPSGNAEGALPNVQVNAPGASGVRTTTSRPRSAPIGSPLRHVDLARPLSSPSQVGGIRRMSSACSQLMRTGQAVLDAAAVVKELVENSLDAGATRVDIRLKGKAATERITVSDNGSGIRPESLEALCLAHSTSKLSKMSDLDSLATFGFRGEAMSAIASLAERVTVTTRTSSDTIARLAVYSSDGSLAESSPAARPVGTTVQVENLFARLPVRLQEAHKHSSRDVSKCLSIVQEYALISPHVRFELRVGSDTKLLTRPSVGLDLQSDDALRYSIAAVLGRGQADAMVSCSKTIHIPVARAVGSESNSNHQKMERAGPSIGSDEQIADGDPFLVYKLRGLISKTNYGGSGGGGRLSGSWQFIYVNSRPVDLPRVARAINESFRRFALSSQASPAFVLAFELPEGTFDVNMSPDKRQVMIHEDALLIKELQEHLESIWSPQKSRVLAVEHNNGRLKMDERMFSPQDRAHRTEGKLHHVVDSSENDEPLSGADREQNLEDDGGTPRSDDMPATATEDSLSPLYPDNPSVEGQKNDLTSLAIDKNANSFWHVEPKEPLSCNALDDGEQNESHVAPGRASFEEPRVSGEENRTRQRQRIASAGSSGVSAGFGRIQEFIARRQRTSSAKASAANDAYAGLTEIVEVDEASEELSTRITASEKYAPAEIIVDSVVQASASGVKRVAGVLPYEFNAIVRRREKRRRTNDRIDYHGGDQAPLVRSAMEEQISVAFSCSIGANGLDPELTEVESECARAESELTRVFRQEWFTKLRVIGQFNLGFVICTLGDKDMFIVDQHASDEKFNFETLQRTTPMETQRLVQPLALHLSAEDELVVLENLDRFRRGGFDIQYRAERRPTERLYLVSQPSSKRTIFVTDDLRDMIASLKVSSGSTIARDAVLRPPRVRAMFASRACRKSIMIGTPLSVPQMTRVLSNLASLEHPWMCPHGRPTMRHLLDLSTF